jgi:hypothetical protein
MRLASRYGPRGRVSTRRATVPMPAVTLDGMSSRPLPPWLLAPVAREHRPPVRTKALLLPFGELDPPDFERLCVALGREDGEPEACRLYGTRGQAQHGIDLYARLRNGRYATYQCKRYGNIIDSDIKNAVAEFREGDWLARSERFVFCTSHQTVRTDHSEEIERQTSKLRDDGVAFEVWDAEELSARLKTRPRMVLDFFGRPWVDEFCTEPLVDTNRLDASEIARLRARLREFYSGLFARHDALVDDRAPVSKRFVEPDVLRIRHLPQEQDRTVSPEPSGTGDRDQRPPQALTDTVDALLSERVGALAWLQTHRRTLLLGGAGSGKSTLLRWLCLELLAEEPKTPGPAARDGAFVAVWLPFGRWVAAIAAGDRDLSLPGLLHRFFAAYAADDVWRLVEAGLNDDRLVLLVDGLDEWSDESAADIAADRLQQYLLQRSLPALAGTRPESLRVLRAVDPEWSTAELAPLSGDQQRDLLEQLGAPTSAATALVREASGAVRLQRVARNPLLLGLMWRLQEGGVELPTDSQAVFAAFIRWLIRTQAPARRRIAEVDNPLDLDGDEIEAALAALALAAQESPSPALAVAEARRAVMAFLADAASTGLTAPHARTQARLLIEQARGAIGVLSQLDDDHLIFAHRALQEHLAGRALSRLEPNRQEELARTHAADPGWRNALEALVWMAPSAAQADALIVAIARATGTPQAQWVVMPLLAQLALGSSRATLPTRRAALSAACDFVESDDRPGPRGDTLDLLVAGVGLDNGLVVERLRRWWPCRAEDRSRLLDGMHEWPDEPETFELWWRALADENTATARKAGALLVDRLAGDGEAGDRLAGMLRSLLPVHSRATALETLGRGWPEHPELAGGMQRGLQSPDPNLRLVALDLLVRHDRHDERHLRVALELANGWIGVDFERRTQAGDVLLSGWPGHERVRDAVLLTVDDRHRQRPLEIQLATWLLVHSFSDDPAARAWVQESLQDEHPFVLLPDAGWRLVGERYRGDAEILQRLEALFRASDTAREVNLCQLAVGLRTAAARDYLLALLHRTKGFPSAGWPFGSLVEGWSNDAAVMDDLRAFGRSGDSQVAEVAHWLDDVLSEPEATTVLIDLARDPANERAAAALAALARRDDPAVRAEAFEIGWGRRHERPAFGAEVADVLLAYFGEEPRVPDLALERLDSPDAQLGLRAIAQAGRHHAEVREALRRIAIPLPVELRRRLTQRLFERDRRDPSLTANWRLERDGMAAAAAASATAAAIPAPRRGNLVEEAVDALHARRLDREVEGQAGLCALLELGEIARFAEQSFGHDPNQPLWVEFGVFRRNWWMAARVAAHFEDVRAALGEDMPQRFHVEREGRGFWSTLAPFAMQTPVLRDAVLAFIREHGTASSPELLRFLAAARPRSRELADALVAATKGAVLDRSDARTALLLAAELLGQHFAGDAEVLAALRQDSHSTEGELLALAMGWRRTPEARAAFDAASRDRLPLSRDVAVRLHLLIADSDEALEALCSWLREGEGQSWLVAPPTTAALRRTAGDARFAEALRRRIKDGAAASEVGSGARLLAAAGRLDRETRGALEARCAAALTGPDTELIGLDMIAEELRPLGWILWDALYGAATTDPG